MKTKIVLSVMLTLIVSQILAQENWVQLSDFPMRGRAGAIATTLGDRAYIGLGTASMPATDPEYDKGNNKGVYNDFWEFNPNCNVWTQKAGFPGHERQAAIAFSIGNKAYVGTGLFYYTVFNDIYEYDPNNNSWRQMADYPGGPRYLAMAFSIGNKGYLGAGKDQGLSYGTSDFYEFDPSYSPNGKWTKKSDIGDLQNGYIRRSTGVAFAIGNKGYIGLGVKDYDYRLTDLWEYNPDEDYWVKKHDFPSSPELGYGRWGGIAFTILDKGYVGSGYYYEPHGDIWEYDPISDTWTEKPEIDPLGRGQGIAFSIGNHAYVGLGYNNQPDYLKDIRKYSFETDINCVPSQQLCFNTTNSYTIPQIIIGTACEDLDIRYTITGATSRVGTGKNASGQFNPGLSLITWQVTDCYGKNLTSTTIVNIDYHITVTIEDQYAVNPGGEINTIYIGYGPTSLTYKAAVTGGTPFDDGSYQYLWSTGETTSNITVMPTVPGLYNYMVTVTDKYGCTQTQSIVVNVIDVRCGKNLDKVELCKTPPGNPDKTTVVCINKEDVVNQLKNGSMLSVCSPVVTDYLSGDNQVTIFPNPNGGAFNVMITDLASSWCEVRVLDRNGMTIDSKNVSIIENTQSVPFELSTAVKGLYFIKVSSSEGVKMYKVMLE